MKDRDEEDRYATGEHPGRQPDQAEGERRDGDEHPMPEEARRPTPGQAEGERGTTEPPPRSDAENLPATIAAPRDHLRRRREVAG